MDIEYGIFVREPEWDHPIYHLSEDDERALREADDLHGNRSGPRREPEQDQRLARRRVALLRPVQEGPGAYRRKTGGAIVTDKARRYIEEKHKGQVYARKNQDWPYVTHCIAVAEPFAGHEVLEDAALLHDVVEDADAALDDIEMQFGADVAALVDTLTRKENESYAEYIERVGRDPRARQIKLVDLAYNLTHCVRPDAPVYTRHLIPRYLKAIKALTG